MVCRYPWSARHPVGAGRTERRVSQWVRDRRPHRRSPRPRHHRPRPTQPPRKGAPQGWRRRHHHWQTATARLLPRLLAWRRSGPVYLTDRATRLPLAPADLDTNSGRARLSYRRAAELFTQATTELEDGPWTLHQLQHSALTHAAETGANTATLLSYSGHTSIASLARYTRVSPEALARWQNDRDPAQR